MIFTIGYEKLKPERLAQIAEGLNADVIDCRYKPYGRMGFTRPQLMRLLGDRYQWHGHHLGGFGHTSKDGIRFLRDFEGEDQPNVLLLCKEHSPLECHRHKTICGPWFPEALHVHDEDVIEAQELARADRENDPECEVRDLKDYLRDPSTSFTLHT